MRQFTTPVLLLTVKDQLIADKEIWVTLKGIDTTLTLKTPAIYVTETEKDTNISVYLTQEQTAKFRPHESAAIQVNWMNETIRCATNIAYVRVADNILKEILP